MQRQHHYCGHDTLYASSTIHNTPDPASISACTLLLLLLLRLQASPPDVWRQLRELCLEDKWGAAAIRELEACQHQARQHVSTTYQQHLYWP
jgi:hypothetical protein